ncbi:MAG: putative delta-60 repeat protein [Planctomycetota bacterium]
MRNKHVPVSIVRLRPGRGLTHALDGLPLNLLMSQVVTAIRRVLNPRLPLLAVLLVAAGCSSGGSDALVTPTDDLRTPGILVDAQGSAEALQTDLPGRLSVLVQVMTKDERPVADLTADNFRLYEEGVLVSPSESQQRLLPRPRTFRSFSHLLLDISGSVAQTQTGLELELQAAHRFVDEATSASENYISISWFFGAPNIAPALLDDLTQLGFTNDADLLHEAIDNVGLIQVTSTSTNLHGAIIQGLDSLDEAQIDSDLNEDIEFTSLSLVTFTDGSDQAGIVDLQDALDRFHSTENEYNALTIGLGSEIDVQTLTLLGPSGFTFVGNESSLISTFASVGAEVRNLANSFYLVGYVSPKVDGAASFTLTVEAFNSLGSASKPYDANPGYFSGGGGFLDVHELDAAGSITGSSQLAAMDDGRMLLAWSADTQGSGDVGKLSISRRHADGHPDATFGPGIAGVVELASIGAFDRLIPVGLVVQPEGSGWVLVEASDFAGSLDPRAAMVRFGVTGSIQAALVLAPITSEAERPRDLTRNPIGRILVLSEVGEFPISRTLVRQLDSTTLSPDPSFGGGGSVLFAADSVELRETPACFTVDTAGRIFIAGGSYNTLVQETDLAVTCLEENGSVDSNFGNQGRVFHHASFEGFTEGLVHDVVVDDLGRVVVAGELLGQVNHPGPMAAWWRLTAEGLPDTTFTGNAGNPFLFTGLVTFADALVSSPSILFGDTSKVLSLAPRPGGELLSAGLRMNARSDMDLCFWSFSDAGIFRQGYNATGFLIEDGTVGQGSDESMGSMLIHPSGQVFVLGGSNVKMAPENERKVILWQDSEIDRVFGPYGSN